MRRVDPARRRLTRLLYLPVVREAAELPFHEAKALVGNFSRLAEPLPIDPRWNRLWAMIWEGPQGTLEDAEDYWAKYVEDLKTLPALRAEERDLAQALVWKHVGREYVSMATAYLSSERGGRPHPDGDWAREGGRMPGEEFTARAGHRETYWILVDAYSDWDESEKAAGAARRLLEVFPDDIESLSFLSDYHLEREEPARRVEYSREPAPSSRSTSRWRWMSGKRTSHWRTNARWSTGGRRAGPSSRQPRRRAGPESALPIPRPQGSPRSRPARANAPRP